MLGKEVWVHPFLRGSWQLFAAIIDVCGLWWLSSKDCLQCRRMGLIPALGRSPGGRYGNPLQYSCPFFLFFILLNLPRLLKENIGVRLFVCLSVFFPEDP